MKTDVVYNTYVFFQGKHVETVGQNSEMLIPMH